MAPSSICIDGFNLSLRKGSGIATYGRNLNLALRDMGMKTHILYGPLAGRSRNNLLNQVALNDGASPPDREMRLARFMATEFSAWGRLAQPVTQTAAVQPSPAMSRAKADQWWAARDVFEAANRSYLKYKLFTPVRFSDPALAPGIMHWTCPMPLKAKAMANLYTIHDLVPLRMPFATLDNKRAFHRMCKTICRKADHVVTVSESARRDLIEMFGIDENRVTNTYQAASLPEALTARPDDEVAAEVEGIFGLGWRRYFLFFGAIEPKKNLGRVIEAYLSSGVQDPLVIIGGSAWLDEYETKMLYEDLVTVQTLKENTIRRADRIRRYDYLPLHSLVSLIRGAKATLFPSLYEGFGLPVLESMQLGAPVLTSTAGSLPEVAGEAALSVDPYDVEAIVRGIRALDADADLRSELSARGRIQATKFSPAAYGARLATVYAKLG
ncbi:MAG: hypothetical protein JWM33_2224 [Caulobacteraceae bacterium]|nr:hypothetical protein [Caulobacteraceae bacterium]